MKPAYLTFSFVVPGEGVKVYVARLKRGKGGKAPNMLFEDDKFRLYIAGKSRELRLYVPTSSERRLRRFLRNYCVHENGMPHYVKYWTSPFRP